MQPDSSAWSARGAMAFYGQRLDTATGADRDFPVSTDIRGRNAHGMRLPTIPWRLMTSLSLMLRPTESGWAVCLSDGQELSHFSGWFARRLAVGYLEHYIEQLQRP